MLNGLIAPITTPFSEEGELLYEALEKNIERYLSTSLRGFLVLGTTGEAAHLSASERLDLAQRVSEMVPTDRIFMVGVSFPSLYESLDFIGRIQNLRVDAVLLSTPSYYKTRMNQVTLADYYRKVAEKSPFPVLLYNIPKFSGIVLGIPLLRDLAFHPNISGVKESSGNLIYLQNALQATKDAEFQVISGNADTYVLAMPLGIKAGILAVGCAVPEVVDQAVTAYESQSEDLASFQARLFRISATVVGKLSIPGIKYAMDLKGYKGLYCRSPLGSLTDVEKAEVDAILL
jgi:4-hydroxy-2-oxoglutarate aldolase